MCDVFLGPGVKIDYLAKKGPTQSERKSVVLSFAQKVRFGHIWVFWRFWQILYVKHVKSGPHFQRGGHTLAGGRF